MKHGYINASPAIHVLKQMNSIFYAFVYFV